MRLAIRAVYEENPCPCDIHIADRRARDGAARPRRAEADDFTRRVGAKDDDIARCVRAEADDIARRAGAQDHAWLDTESR